MCITLCNTEETPLATRTVRLDDETELVLDEVRTITGLAVSDALKAGLRSLQEKLRAGESSRSPYEIFCELDLGPGGYALAPSTDVRSAIRRKLKAKHPR